MMVERLPGLLSILEYLNANGGSATPTWNAASERGYIYELKGDVLNERDLEQLASREYLNRTFVDRVSRCPSCRSHHLNTREICIACKNPRIAAVDLLHHFRCGYVAPAYEFPFDRDARRCPKCHGHLKDLGTDHDVPGPHFICRSCEISFQTPEIGMLCLSCGRHLDGADLAKIVFEDVFTYTINAYGLTAVRLGRLQSLEEDEEYASYPLMLRSVFMAFLEDEEKRRRHFGTTYSIILVSAKVPPDPPADAELLNALRVQLNETDKVTRYDERRFMILLPGVNVRKAKALAAKLSNGSSNMLESWGVQAHVMDIGAAGEAIQRMTSTLATVAGDV